LIEVSLDNDAPATNEKPSKAARKSDVPSSSSSIRNPVIVDLLKTDKTAEEIAFDQYGFYQPPKITRRLPLRSRASNPAECLDIIDDMYAFYCDTEVSLFIFVSCCLSLDFLLSL
jgi:hypothetical protein